MYKTEATTYNLSNDDAHKLEDAFVRKQSPQNQKFYKVRLLPVSHEVRVLLMF